MLLFITSVTILIVPVLSGYPGDICYDGENQGSCTPLSQCQPLMDEIRAAGSPMPLHMNRRLTRLGCGYIGNEPLVCCSFDMNSKTSLPTRRPTVPSIDTSANWNITDGTRANITTSVIDDAEAPDVTNHPNLGLLPRSCGSLDTDRIMGGNQTQLYEMPWMVILSYDTARGKRFACGGTLISARYVLTAAHCTRPRAGMTLVGVTLGEHDVTTDPDCEVFAGNKSCAATVVNATIEEVISHPGYRRETLFDDIALIRLAEPANLSSDTIGTICLPSTRALQQTNLDALHAVVAGWGITEQKIASSVLLRVSLPIITNEECQKSYKGIARIYSRQLCAGGVAGTDSCSGDSGGPLMYPGQVSSGGVRYVQHGIVSFGPRSCGIGVLPGVYTRLSHHMKWILDNMRS